MKKYCYSFFAFIISFNFYGQIDFLSHTVIDDTHSVNGGAFSIFPSDIDNDGDIDLISASRFDDKIAWYENDGLGNFGEQRIISLEADLALFVFAKDIDGDGDVDILSASYEDNKIAWYKNLDGQGNFGAQNIITTNAIEVKTVFAEDIDGDGDMDVICGSSSDGEISWFENLDGQGNFSNEQIISSDLFYSKWIRLSDLDGDGDNDVLTTQGNVYWCKNLNGQGDFSSKILIGNLVDANTIYTNDIDNDGDLDVIASSTFSYEFGDIVNEIYWFENVDGQGNFVQHQILYNTNGFSPRQIYLADIDDDDDYDLFAISGSSIILFENLDGQGNFGSQQTIVTNIETGVAIIASDIDTDGDNDVVFSSLYDEIIAWSENIDGLGSFSEPTNIMMSIGYVQDTFAADIDNDGDMDVLSASSFDDKIAWYENIDGQGNFGLQKVITTSAEGAWKIKGVDIDGDNDIDILSASIFDDKIAWYENVDGHGNFGNQQIITVNADNVRSVFFGDIDNDGDIDVLSASINDNKIAWYENTNGLGSFGNQQIVSTNAIDARAVHVNDLDGDGDLDVLSASLEDNKIAWYENVDGVGNFGQQQIITSNALYAGYVTSGDIDGDGDIDIIASGEDNVKIAWYENTDGLGNFSTMNIVSTEAIGVSYVNIADIDNDGDLDVVAACSYYVSWYENLDGLGNFSEQLFIETPQFSSKSVFVVDINNDGKQDVLSASSYYTTSPLDKIAWHENLGILAVNEIKTIDFSVYPNPTSGLLTINNKVNISQIIVYNQQGQLLLSNTNKKFINISKLNKGIYFIKIKDVNDKIGVQKIVKF